MGRYVQRVVVVRNHHHVTLAWSIPLFSDILCSIRTYKNIYLYTHAHICAAHGCACVFLLRGLRGGPVAGFFSENPLFRVLGIAKWFFDLYTVSLQHATSCYCSLLGQVYRKTCTYTAVHNILFMFAHTHTGVWCRVSIHALIYMYNTRTYLHLSCAGNEFDSAKRSRALARLAVKRDGNLFGLLFRFTICIRHGDRHEFQP